MKPSSDTSPSPPNMNKDFEYDESDRDHAQDGQEPVETVQEVSGETQKDNKEKKSGSKPYSPTVQWLPQDKEYPARLSSSGGWSAAPRL